ncbi:MAG: peroxiredoxin family protein [Parvularcula sp.]|jgi:peroxiredoxin|nr:peroxiredoxin family protein [Parvularcula sp.]
MMLTALLASLYLFAGLGPAPGTAVPQAERFAELGGDEGATLVFVRSVVWCPYCQNQVIELAAKAEDFEAAGRPLVIISYDKDEEQASFAEKHQLDLVFLSDEGSELIRAFGLLNEAHEPGSRAYGIPHPAVFVIDESGTVTARLYEEDYAVNDKSYRNRPAAETILRAAKGSPRS